MTYKNFNDEEVTEDHYFNLTQAELVEMEHSIEGGLHDHLQRIVETEDAGEIMKTFKMLLLRSYGKKSDDGKRFIKNEQLREEFESSEAYSKIYMGIVTDAAVAAEFTNNIMPAGMKELAEKMAAQQDKPDLSKPPEIPKGQGGPQKLGVAAQEQRIITMAEAQAMDGEELSRLLTSGEARLASTEG